MQKSSIGSDSDSDSKLVAFLNSKWFGINRYCLNFTQIYMITKLNIRCILNNSGSVLRLSFSVICPMAIRWLLLNYLSSALGKVPRMAEWQFHNCLPLNCYSVVRLTFFPNLTKGNSVTNSFRIAIRPITLKLKGNLRYFKFTIVVKVSPHGSLVWAPKVFMSPTPESAKN